MANYSEETMYRIWNDHTGECVQAGEDADGLGLVEFRNYASDGTITQTLTLTTEQAEWLCKVLPDILTNIQLSAADDDVKS